MFSQVSNPTVDRLKRTCAYLVAVVMPGPTIYLSLHSRTLRAAPLALNLILIATIARVLGLGPAVVAIVTTAISFNYFVFDPSKSWSSNAQPIIQTFFIVCIASLVAFLFQQYAKREKALRLANAELEEKSDALTQAQQGSNSAAWLFDTRTRKTTWYEGGSEIFGRSLEEITAMGSPNALVLEEDRPLIAVAATHTSLTGEPFHVEFRVLWPNGQIRWLEARGTPKTADPAIWLGVTTDVTNRKKAELALLRSEKLAVAGRLASSVAHEINNPLESVTNLIFLAKAGALSPETQSYLDAAEKEVRRIAQVTAQALQFHKQQAAPAHVDLAEMLRSILLFCESKIARSGITVKFEATESLPLVCSESEMRQALSHLVGNALDAMPNGGELWLRMRPRTDWRSGMSSIRITVADTGNGMSPEIRKRMYEPFFTTKDSVNTGLGLWVTADIVARHGGSIHVRSSVEPGKSGSIFTVILPMQP